MTTVSHTPALEAALSYHRAWTSGDLDTATVFVKVFEAGGS